MEIDLKGHHILIVEDDIICFSLLDEFLADTGVTISHAMTGLEAVKFCKKHDDISIVIMDMRLPELDGFQATKIIKEFRPNLPIIAHTANTLQEDYNQCINSGCDDFMPKPIDSDKLMQVLKKYILKL